MHVKAVRGTKITSPLTTRGSASAANASGAYAAGALIKNSSGIVVDTIWVTCAVVNLESPLSGLDSPNAKHDFSPVPFKAGGFRKLSHLGGSNGNSN